MRRIAFLLFAILLAATSFAATASAPTNVQLTIYNQNFALVKENRDMSLEKGMNTVSILDVAARIEPSSVAFKSLTDPNAVVVREQNYQYDLVNSRTILNKSLGKRVKIIKYLDGTVKEIEGIVLSTPENGLVLQTANGIVLNPSGEIQVMEMPQGLVPRPTLAWKLDSDRAGPQKTEISYLTNNITWSADYVAVVDSLDKYVDLTGWVTLDNKSGVTYENASLNLMAGDVHRVQPQREFEGFALTAPMAAKAAEPQFAEKAFFEYHLYTLKDKTTVRDKESKQISLLTAAHIPAKKVYVYDGARNQRKVNVLMEIVNSQASNLGMPLPKGKVRVYKQESDANQHFIGEDLIDHTPKDEKVRLYLGDAFDLVGERKQMTQRQISDHEREESYEISLRNHKDLPVTIVIVEHLWGDWKITQSSHGYNKKDANTVEIPVEVPKDGEVKVTYTVRIKW
ncbi:MAG TPA: DUF4139 domain-containing protein [Armatimonadota bacterium]|nr:DUF4139 domain-containing protein [Armatimonadota bacterium]